MIPYDYSRCEGASDGPCNRCERKLAPRREGGPQTFSVYPGGSDCLGFIPVEGEQ